MRLARSLCARGALAALLALHLGCAAITVTPEGDVRAWAFAGGEASRCVPRGEAGVLSGAPEECVKVEAESIPSAVLGIIGQGLTALIGWIIP